MINLEYLAGFFDGEGTFWLGTQIKPSNGISYGKAVVMLSQSGDNGLALLEKIQSSYGGKIYQHLKVGDYKATKPAYKLYWNKGEAIKLIQMLLPYLILKKDAAQQVLNYLTRNE